VRIIILDQSIVFARVRGTLGGVYTFSLDYFGVRFLTHDHMHVPQVGKRDVGGQIDERDCPDNVRFCAELKRWGAGASAAGVGYSSPLLRFTCKPPINNDQMGLAAGRFIDGEFGLL